MSRKAAGSPPEETGSLQGGAFTRAKRGRGRPSKLTPEVQEKIVQAVAAGNYMETAAAFAGVHRFTLHRWLKLGADAKSGKYRDFCDAVQEAMAKAEIRDVAIIGQAATKQWQAAAWRLERKFPERWGRKTYHNVQGVKPSAILEALEKHEDWDGLRRIADGEDAMVILMERIAEGQSFGLVDDTMLLGPGRDLQID